MLQKPPKKLLTQRVLTAAHEQGIHGRADSEGIDENKILEGDIKFLNNGKNNTQRLLTRNKESKIKAK